MSGGHRSGLEQLQAACRGRVVSDRDADYDQVRAACVWNGDIDRRPWAIAQATSAADVAAAIRVAADAGLEVTVRGGGHNFAGSCIADGALMVDLGPMDQVRVDPAARRAVCGGGTRWAQLDAATQEHGLATPGGFISHTGVAGLTLGGGLGWLTRKVGLSADNVVSVEVVTADGSTLRASAEEHPDLFWAVRGGGGNFGVVTAFEFELHEVGPVVQLALTFWDLDSGGSGFRALRALRPTLGDDIGVFQVAINLPPAPFVPDDLRGQLGYAVLLVGHGPPEEHAGAVAALRSEAPPRFTFDTPIPYTALQQMFDESAPWGICGYEKALHLDELTDAAIEVIAEHVPKKTSPMSFTPTFVLGGAFGRHDEADSAFGGSRGAQYVLNIVAVAPSRAQLEPDREWARAFWSDLVPHASGIGSYVNFMTEIEPDRVAAAYGTEKLERLRRVKGTYDPDNVFRHNANIAPAMA